MKIAVAQINPTVGDLRENSRKIQDFARRARRAEADLVVFPEMCVTGYPPLDLLENDYFIDAAKEALDWIARHVPRDLGVIVGLPLRNTSPIGKRLRNAAVLLHDGAKQGIVYKTLLPTYDVFDEHRYFEPAAERRVIEWRGVRLGLHICEDMWNSEQQAEFHMYGDNPVDELAADAADLFINISASPFSRGKHARRNQLIGEICRRHGIPFILANQAGANTEIIFDGDSRVHRADGALALCAPSFEEALLVWDTKGTYEPCALEHEDVADLHDALVLGVRDYFEKTGFFAGALVGLSGGVDSAVTCALAVEAIGADSVVGITMPSRYSSQGSVDDSGVLAEALGIRFHRLSIEPAVGAFEEMLADLFAGTSRDVTEENIQARIRGVALMAYSNKFNYLLLSTGNKSESAVGYSTLYGDMNGGLAVISDVFKTEVYDLARYINRRADRAIIPDSTLDKPPSAELRPNQRDDDTLPPYPVLDRILRLYVEKRLELDAVVDHTGIDRKLVQHVLRLVDQNEYKRRQAPPGLRVSEKAFGMGRRLPIVMRWSREVGQEIVQEGTSALDR